MLIFLKLGGSLITDKSKPYVFRKNIVKQAASEIKQALADDPELKLIIGHGSGSFGHVSANQYNTIRGVHTPEEWSGFIKVWSDARGLHNLVMDELRKAGVPALSYPPSSQVITSAQKITQWNLNPIRKALENHILPVVYGDVVFDRSLNGTILSTEDLFSFLAKALKPDRILLAGIDQGVYADFPKNTRIIERISPKSYMHNKGKISLSAVTDVTGGMAGKVSAMIELVQKNLVQSVSIFSGVQKGQVLTALRGQLLGTTIAK